MQNIWLHRYAVVVAVCTLLLVAAGATVTSKEAGLSVPDWPLSYGKIMPPMTGNIFYEHGHRMIASTVGLLTVILAIWLWRADSRRWMRNLGWAALAAVILQGALGGMTVLLLLPKPVSIAHACLAQLFFSATVLIALFTSRGWHGGPELFEERPGLSLRGMALAAPVCVLGQLVLGAAYRHKAIELAWHVVGAAVVAGVVLFTAVFALLEMPRHRAVSRAAVTLLALTFTQVFLGVAAYMSRVATAGAPQPVPVMVWFTVLHVATGALTLAAGTMFAVQVRRHVRLARAERSTTGAAFAHPFAHR